MRLISHTEANALLDCEARWDFAYGGQLAGAALRPKVAGPRLREGRAWGRAVAAWHSDEDAHAALVESIDADVAEIIDAGGAVVADEVAAMRERLTLVLDHYTSTAERLRLTAPEHELEVAIPSRTGRRRSNRYRFRGYLDGVEIDEDLRPWIVEFKLRGELSSFERLTLDRQGRRYAWAWWRANGVEPAGIVYDERLNEAPRAPKINRDGRPSTDKRQHTTPDLYAAACQEAGVEPDPETLAAFADRRWQQRHRIVFRAGELVEAGRELVAIAQRVADLEGGRLPIRAPSTFRCRTCPFSGVCPNPTDAELVDAEFTRQPAKRDREEIAA